jgi:predicted Zn-dependent peptidase
MKYKKTTLKNGLRILTIPMKETQTATVMVAVGVGSRYETEKEAGLSHFIEHMMFKGTEKRPTTLDISEELDAIGGEYNAFTAKDKTFYYAKADAGKLDVALDVIADMYLHSKVDAEEIEREKGTILQEINMYEDTPTRRVGDYFEELMYQKNSLGRDIVGSKETVSNFKREDFLKYTKRFYVANDTVICVAGKINEKKVVADIRKYFSAMNKGVKPKFQKVVEIQKKPAVVLKFKKTDQTHFILGNRAFHENHPDRFALSLLSIILGGNMSSRLFIEVRERRGLAYHVSTGVDSYTDCGYIATQAGVEHKNLELTIKTILDEYRKITSEKVNEKELQKAKDYVRGKSVMGLESSDEVAMFYLDQELKKKKVLSVEELMAKIDQVTAKDIQRVAQKVFRNDNLNLAVIGPHKNAQKLQKLLKL